MKRRYRILGGLLALLVLAVLALGRYVGHDGPCGSAPALPAGAVPMKAIIYRCYGGPEVLRLETIARPIPGEHQVLVKVQAASVNPLDWHYMLGTPYLVRLSAGIGVPKDVTNGADFAGTVEAVGSAVTRFKPGDAVFGDRGGAFAEYVNVIEDHAIAHMPANASFAQAAALPIAGLTALQALRDTARLQRGQKILINGASGGVGTFAVQIARSFGAEVTAVCSTRNLELVRSLGADHVVDYTREDFTRGTQKYDVILDTVGNRALSDLRRVLAPAATVVLIGGGGPDEGKWIWPLVGPLKAVVYSWFVSQRFTFMMADANAADLGALAKLVESGQVKSVIDRRYPLAETPAAVAYVETGHARGKVIIDVMPPPAPTGGADGFGPVAAPAGARPFKVGALELVALHDAEYVSANKGEDFGVDAGPAAVAALLKTHGLPEDRIVLSVNVLLLRSGTRLYLFDAGLGPKYHGGLIESLKLAGFTPDQVTDVLITHSHRDHVGGLLDTNGTLAFPKATIRMSAAEWNFLKSEPPMADLVKAIDAHVQTFTAGERLAPEIRSVDLHGHTPGHVAYEIGTGATRLLDIGDAAHSALISLSRPEWINGFDTDTTLARSTRRALLAQLAGSHEAVFSPHFPFPGFGHIVAEDAAYRWEPIP